MSLHLNAFFQHSLLCPANVNVIYLQEITQTYGHPLNPHFVCYQLDLCEPNAVAYIQI